jgi:hypothetical protein
VGKRILLNGGEALSPKLDWTLVGLLLLAFSIRVAAIIKFPSLHHPDEAFQLFEQGYRLAFGRGIVPWEFVVGSRSYVVPTLLGLIFAAAEPVVGGPSGYLFVARAMLALTSLGSVVAVYRMGLRLSPLHALLAGLVVATWFEFVYFAGRPLTEALATTALLIGLSLASVPDEDLTDRRLFWMGLCLALCVMLRLQLLPGIFIAAAWVGRLHLNRWKLMMVGALFPVCVFGVTDLIAWDLPFYSYFESVRLNLFKGVAANFGTEPINWYLHLLASKWSYALPLILGLVALRVRTSLLSILVALVIIISHSLIAHKEYRFVFPALASLVVVAALGSADLVRFLGTRLVWPAAWVAAMTWIAISAALAFAPAFRAEWFRSQKLIEAQQLLAKQKNLCGVLLYDDIRWYKTGGHSHLHRDVPIYAAQPGSFDAAKVKRAFNGVILRRSSTTSFPHEFKIIQCIGVGKAKDVCVMMREGACETVPHFVPCSVAPLARPDPSRADPCRWRSGSSCGASTAFPWAVGTHRRAPLPRNRVRRGSRPPLPYSGVLASSLAA